MRSILPPDYRPSEDEAFMNENQREYFRQKLLNWRSELIRDSVETRRDLENGERGGSESHGDPHPHP